MGLHPISLSEMMTMDIKEPEFLIDGVVTGGSATILTGREKSGKGLLAIDMACCVASGVPWIGRAVLEGPVIYLALEESIRTLRDRVMQWTNGVTDFPLYFIVADGSTEDAFSLEDPGLVAALIAVAIEIEPVLIIIDTLRESHRGREDSSDDMAPRLRPIRQLAHQLDVTVIVTHHQSKMAGGSRGSTAIRASFDDEISFVRTDVESAVNVSGKLRFEGRNIPKQTVHVEFDATSARWVPSHEPEVVDASIRSRICRVLEDSQNWLTAREIAAALVPVKLKTVQNELSRMVAEQVVAVSGAGTKASPRRFSCWARRLADGSTDDGMEDERAA